MLGSEVFFAGGLLVVFAAGVAVAVVVVFLVSAVFVAGLVVFLAAAVVVFFAAAVVALVFAAPVVVFLEAGSFFAPLEDVASFAGFSPFVEGSFASEEDDSVLFSPLEEGSTFASDGDEVSAEEGGEGEEGDSSVEEGLSGSLSPSFLAAGSFVVLVAAVVFLGAAVVFLAGEDVFFAGELVFLEGELVVFFAAGEEDEVVVFVAVNFFCVRQKGEGKGEVVLPGEGAFSASFFSFDGGAFFFLAFGADVKKRMSKRKVNSEPQNTTEKDNQVENLHRSHPSACKILSFTPSCFDSFFQVPPPVQLGF